MKRLHLQAYRLLLAALLVLSAGTAAASQIVVVTPTPGNPVQSGNDFKAAHDAIIDNSWSKRYLVLLEPGVYDLGSQNIQMKDFVDIAGSGVEGTFVYGNGNLPNEPGGPLNRGLIQAARNNELRDLTLRVFATPERPYLIPIYLGSLPGGVSSTTKVRNVRTNAFGTADYCTGIEGNRTYSVVEDVQVRAQCSGNTTGIVFATSVAVGDPSPKVRRVDVVASSETTAQGILVQHLAFGYPSITIEDSTVVAGGTGTALALDHRNTPGSSGNLLTVTDTTFIARSTGTNKAASLDTGPSGTTFRHSRLLSLPGTLSVGVEALSTQTPTSIENSLVSGVTGTISGGFAGVRVGNSKLEGGPVSGSVTCAGIYDENFLFFASTCP